MLYGKQCTRNFKALLEYLDKSKMLTIEIATSVDIQAFTKLSLETHTMSIYFFSDSELKDL